MLTQIFGGSESTKTRLREELNMVIKQNELLVEDRITNLEELRKEGFKPLVSCLIC